MVQSTQKPIVVARISFERTRLSPQCLAETYARIVPVTRKVIRAGATATPEAITGLAAKRRAEHG